MVWTCVDYALHQLNEIQAFEDDLDCEFDRNLFIDVRFMCENHLGLLNGYYDQFERNLVIDERWKEGYYDQFERNLEIDEHWKEAHTQIHPCTGELMFLKMIFWCFATWDDDTDGNLRSMLTILQGLWEDFGDRVDDNILLKIEPGKQDWDLLASFLEDTIQQSKILMVDYHHALLHSSFQYKPLPSDQMFQFLQLVLHNLDVLIPLMKKQTDTLKARLILSRSFFQFMTAHEGVDCKELRTLRLCFQTFANEVASLFFLFWVNAENGNLKFESNIHQMLSDMHQNIIKPCGNDATAVYFVALKAIKLQPSDDPFLYEQIVVGLVNLHLDELVTASKDDLQIVREGLIFLLSFQSSPPGGCNHDEQLALISHQIDLLFSKCTYLILSPHLIIKDKMFLNDFAEKLKETKDEVEQLYGKVPDSTFPRTNGLGFYYLLLQNLERLKEKMYSDTSFIPFAKSSIVKIVEEMVSLRPLIIGTFELRKEQMELEETWSQLINLAYRTEHVVNSCSVFIHPIWYNMASLSVILDQIQDVKGKLEKVGVKRKLEEAENWRIHDTSVLPTSLQSTSATIESRRFPLNSEEVIILKEETSKIMDELTGGHESLSIISIIGMGGLGKSTLAKAVCNSENVRHHFHKVAWGSVSQVLDKKNFLVEILSGINNCTKDEFDTMTEDDLAHHLWRCLSGQTYLIVVDDIWDIKAWDAVKSSFPDDKNRSRVIFTTRELKVAVDVRSTCHNIRPLFDDESFKLLHMKLFGKNDCPAYASELGKVIVKNCKGLPLSVVVVAGLLASNKTSPSWWKEIAEATCQFVGKECKQIIGYSYKHLPEHLKSCFLYMGIYEEDRLIVAKQLRQLWIGEGFVNKSMTKSLRIMAKDHLRDLVDRNLVTAVDSTLKGEIRTCRLHDLIGDFCRKQAEEDNFLCLSDGYDAFDSSNSKIRSLFRISMRRSFDDVEPTTLKAIHSLLLWHQKDVRKFVIEKLKLVQVLHLEGDVGSKIPDHLVHLRYLALRNAEGKVIEHSICNLWNLETFIVDTWFSGLLKLPKSIWKMKMLRHLEFPKGCVFELEDDENEECQQSLDNLQFLSKLVLHDNTIARAVLQRLPNIQKLKCSLEGRGWVGKVFTIDFMRKLESLRLRVVGDPVHLSLPLTLKRLDIWSREYDSEDLLSAIGKLPCLEVLKLEGLESRWKRWEVEDGQFQKLKGLLISFSDLEEWNVSFDSFYCLEKLSFFCCYCLKEIPACFAECPTLQKIETKEVREELVNSAIQIVQEQKDNGNEVQHLF